MYNSTPTAHQPSMYRTPPAQHPNNFRMMAQNVGQMAVAAGQMAGAAGQSDAGAGPGQAGVGLLFQQAPETGLAFVKAIVNGGSAEKEGTVQVGDVLQSVEGKVCHNMKELRSHILGEVGTFLSLVFGREGPDGQMSTFEVSLMRGNAEYFGQLQHKLRMQEEVEQLRQSLVRAEQELGSLRQALRQVLIRTKACKPFQN